MASFIKKSFGFFILTIIGFFTPGLLYRTIASRPLKNSYLRLGQGVLGLSLYTGILLHYLAPVMILAVFLAIILLIMTSVAVDPFVSWLRGDDEHPWKTYFRYVSQGLWSVLIVLQVFILVLFFIVYVNPDFLGVFESADIENAKSVSDISLFIAFTSFLTIHFYYSQAAASERKQHRFASTVIFAGVYLVMPIVTVIVRNF